MANMPTEDEIAWMQAHINDSTVPDIIACCSICGAASVIILTLRIWSRLQTRRQLVLSDNLVISSVVSIMFLITNREVIAESYSVQVFFIAFCTVFALSTRYGAGRQIILITDPADMRMLAIVRPKP